MATRPARACSRPGCRGIVRGDCCTVCGPRQRTGWHHGGLTRQQRGYDQAWINLRAAHLARHPLCDECQRQGRITPAHHVDHITPFDGLHDPKRLDPSNLRSLCEPCHMRKTARQRG